MPENGSASSVSRRYVEFNNNLYDMFIVDRTSNTLALVHEAELKCVAFSVYEHNWTHIQTQTQRQQTQPLTWERGSTW